ncbi:MAG TPA: DUF4386 domain-containing protein [Thermoanaerobaculia bacterium]|nr:DUF4386 domain-containing protein [Thermoanaerobaculia bacterium]
MSRNAYARLAGFMFLFYIANGITDMVVSGRIRHGADAAAILANIAQHAGTMRFTTFLTFLTGIDAILLGLGLYAITRRVEPDLAILAFAFRVAEGINGVMAGVHNANVVEFATRTAGGADRAVVNTVGTSLLYGGGVSIGGTLFACGSAIFAYLILRGRILPVWLAWIGVAASVLLVVALPLQMCGVAVSNYVWIPMAFFEVVGGVWLLVRGAGTAEESLPASAGFQP